MKKEDITFLRKKYNENVIRNYNLQEYFTNHSIEELQHLPCDSLKALKRKHLKYQESNMKQGKVCFICGLNDMEREILFNKYMKINRKFYKHFKVVKKAAKKSNMSHIIEILEQEIEINIVDKKVIK